MSRRGSDKAVGRPIPVAKGQLPLFPLEDAEAWWTKRPEVTVAQPSQSEEVENPWRGAGSGMAGDLVPGSDTAQ